MIVMPANASEWWLERKPPVKLCDRAGIRAPEER